jgi:hypothetical protein
MASDLVIVYHRQPYEEVEEDGKIVLKENKSPNGIVPTLKRFFRSVDKGAWVAWKLAEDAANPDFERVIEIEDSYGKYSVTRLPLTPDQVSSFYHITSKEAFWPILHSFKERYNYDPVDWPTFREVNWALPKPRPLKLPRARGLGARLQSLAGAGVSAQAAARCADLVLPPHAVPVGGHVQRAALAARDRRKPSGLRRVGFHIPRYAVEFRSCGAESSRSRPGVRVDVNPDFIWEGNSAVGPAGARSGDCIRGARIKI